MRRWSDNADDMTTWPRPRLGSRDWRSAMKVCLALGLGLVIATPAFAAGVPEQLLGKTVSVSFSFGGLAKTEDGRIVSTSKRVAQVIYISSAGRIFARTSQNARKAYAVTEQEPGETSWHFVNGKLISQRGRISGAYMAEISFDPGFQSCTISGTAGHESGKPYKWKGLSGRIFEAAGPLSMSAAACSVSAGNGL
jgi:hypothetical protein